jgi:Ni,Fe-hydrogenase I cytochrome b subunit
MNNQFWLEPFLKILASKPWFCGSGASRTHEMLLVYGELQFYSAHITSSSTCEALHHHVQWLCLVFVIVHVMYYLWMRLNFKGQGNVASLYEGL